MTLPEPVVSGGEAGALAVAAGGGFFAMLSSRALLKAVTIPIMKNTAIAAIAMPSATWESLCHHA